MSAGEQGDSAHGQVHPQDRCWPTVERGAPTGVELFEQYGHARPGSLATGNDARISKGLQFTETNALLDGIGARCKRDSLRIRSENRPSTRDDLGVEHFLI